MIVWESVAKLKKELSITDLKALNDFARTMMERVGNKIHHWETLCDITHEALVQRSGEILAGIYSDADLHHFQLDYESAENKMVREEIMTNAQLHLSKEDYAEFVCWQLLKVPEIDAARKQSDEEMQRLMNRDQKP